MHKVLYEDSLYVPGNVLEGYHRSTELVLSFPRRCLRGKSRLPVQYEYSTPSTVSARSWPGQQGVAWFPSSVSVGVKLPAFRSSNACPWLLHRTLQTSIHSTSRPLRSGRGSALPTKPSASPVRPGAVFALLYRHWGPGWLLAKHKTDHWSSLLVTLSHPFRLVPPRE